LTFEDFLATMREDEDVLGVYLTGSRGRGAFADERSDYDVGLIVRDGALERFDARYPYVRGSEIEIASDTLDGLRAHAAIGSDREWARYQYVHAQVLVDKTGGELQRALDEKERIPDEAHGRYVAAAVGAYVNSYFRSARNAIVGAEFASQLDAAESLSPFLTAIFALEGRVRPYNKFLEWELRRHPLEDWPADDLLQRVERIRGTGDVDEQRALFRKLEQVARRRGYGETIDEWEPDVSFLRGESGYRRTNENGASPPKRRR
jgi:hypothetical protein